MSVRFVKVIHTKKITDELPSGTEVLIKGILPLTTLKLFEVIAVVNVINPTSDLSLR
jgi:hypothetical protein